MICQFCGDPQCKTPVTLAEQEWQKISRNLDLWNWKHGRKPAVSVQPEKKAEVR